MKEAKEPTPEKTPDLDLYGKLRNRILEGRDNMKKQIVQAKEAIEQKTVELETLKIQKLKLEGAVEASEIYLKEVLPNPNPKV